MKEDDNHEVDYQFGFNDTKREVIIKYFGMRPLSPFMRTIYKKLNREAIEVMNKKHELVIKIHCEKCFHVNEFQIPYHDPIHGITTYEEPLGSGHYDRKNNETIQTADTFTAVTKLFYDLGVQPNIRGFSYAREAVCLAVEAPIIMTAVTRELYPLIAGKFNTKAGNVERGIRHAIELLFKKGNKAKLDKYFGFGFNRASHPTNSEFISMLADRVRTGQII